MSEIITKEYYGVPAWVWAIPVVGAVIGGVWLLYQYFVEPGEVILNQYKAILEDIYRETKDFLEKNEKLDPPIYGLTAGQEAIVAAKEEAANYLRPEVEKIIYGRGESVWAWVETAIVGFLLIYGIKEVVPALINSLKKWHTENPEASSKIASQYGHGHLIFNIVANEYAYAGKLNIASAFYNANIPSIYSRFTEPGIYTQIGYFNALLPTLIPGTISYLVAQNMLTYLAYEASVTTGIMTVLYAWWLPLF
jgi:hypothetical protein